MPSINDYGVRATEYKPGQIVRIRSHSRFAHLTDTLRLGKVEKVEPSRLLVRLKHASFYVPREDIQS
jgi:hypothetical protein